MLEKWRLQKNLTLEQVDDALGWSKGMTAKYEGVSLTQVPISDLYRLVRLYGVDPKELVEIVSAATKIRK